MEQPSVTSIAHIEDDADWRVYAHSAPRLVRAVETYYLSFGYQLQRPAVREAVLACYLLDPERFKPTADGDLPIPELRREQVLRRWRHCQDFGLRQKPRRFKFRVGRTYREFWPVIEAGLLELMPELRGVRVSDFPMYFAWKRPDVRAYLTLIATLMSIAKD